MLTAAEHAQTLAQMRDALDALVTRETDTLADLGLLHAELVMLQQTAERKQRDVLHLIRTDRSRHRV